ncbi:MAG: BadF/BadG/BcrA/BcrD ATPase family protein [Gaiellales bacterium]
MDELVLGVDGGNTKTIALVATRAGEIVGWGRGGCADIYGAPTVEDALDEIRGAVRAALPEPGAVTHAVLSLAGADWQEDKDALRGWLSPLVPNAQVEVVNDAIGGLRAGIDDSVGVAVVLGTGGCIGSGGRDGARWHSSWWGLNLGAWWIGREALEAVYAAELGMRPATALTEAALALWGDATVEELLHSFHRRVEPREEWESARFAPHVLGLAHRGDAAAHEIVIAHAAKLADLAAVAARKVSLEPPYPLALLGGVLRGDGASLITAEVSRRLPGAELVRPSREPAAGALLLALDAAGAIGVADRVEASLPGDGLFHTLT